MSPEQGSIKIFSLVHKCCGNRLSLINFEIGICTEVTYLILTRFSLRWIEPHYSVLCVICVVLLWVPAEKGFGTIRLPYSRTHGAPRGKRELLPENSRRRDSFLSMLWNKELRRCMSDLEACRPTETGQGKVMYLSFRVKDCKLCLSRQPKMTVEVAATYEKIAQLLYWADLKERHQLVRRKLSFWFSPNYKEKGKRKSLSSLKHQWFFLIRKKYVEWSIKVWQAQGPIMRRPLWWYLEGMCVECTTFYGKYRHKETI